MNKNAAFWLTLTSPTGLLALLVAAFGVLAACSESKQLSESGAVTRTQAPLLAQDTRLTSQGANEPSIAVSPVNRNIVAIAGNSQQVSLSFDAGLTFPVNVAGPGTSGDPALAFDAQGRLFLTLLAGTGARCIATGAACAVNSCPGAGCTCAAGDTCVNSGNDIIVQQIDARPACPSTLSCVPAGQSRLIDGAGIPCNAGGAAVQCPSNVTSDPAVNLNGFVVGVGVLGAADRQWLVADANPACTAPIPSRLTRLCSITSNNLYVVWSDFAQNPVRVMAASSSDQGANWTAQQLSFSGGADPDGFPQQVHMAVAANGDVWAAFHSQPTFSGIEPNGSSGRTILVRSTTGTAAGFATPSLAANRSEALSEGNADVSFGHKFCSCGAVGNGTCAVSGAVCTFTNTTCPGPGCQCAAPDTCNASVPGAFPGACPNVPIPGFRQCPRAITPTDNLLTQGSVMPYVVPDPTNPQNIAVFASDDPTFNVGGPVMGAGTDTFDIVYVRATNAASNAQPTWEAPQAVNPNGAGLPASAQFFPSANAAINAANTTASCVSLAYYDDRPAGTGALGASLVDVFVTVSPDLWPGCPNGTALPCVPGAPTWGPEVQPASPIPGPPAFGPLFDPDLSAPIFSAHNFCGNPAPAGCVNPPINVWTPTTRMGEYFGLAHANGLAFMANRAGGQIVMFDYSDGIAPVVTAPPAVPVNSCIISEATLGAATATDVCGRPFSTTVNVSITSNLASLTLIPGPNTVTWSGTDGAVNVGTASQSVTVTDGTPPEFEDTALEPVLVLQCDFDLKTVTLTEPVATDDCGSVNVDGTITSSSNPAVPVGTVLTGGTVSLPPGVYTVTWVATDGNNNTDTLVQTVTVQGALRATDSIFVRENFSEVRLPSSGFASMANSGNGITDIRNDARTGDLLSVANVAIGYRATVGKVVSADNIAWDHNAAAADRPAIESETIAPVSLPAAMDLSSITFPTTAGSVAVSDASTPPLAPGNYGSYTVNSNGVLTLQAGVYFFERFTINAAGKVVATPETVIYTKGSDRFQGPIVDSSNALVNVFIGFSGTTLNIETNFVGTIVAPNATVRMGTANAQLLVTGAIHAKVIDLANGADLVCSALPCHSTICGAPPEPPVPTCSDGVQNGTETGVDCGGSCPACPTCNAATYQAEDMFHSTGNAVAGGWNIFNNGYISTPHNFTSGLARVRVRALGQQAAGVLPHMVVSVGGSPVGNVSVTTAAYVDYDFFVVAAAGSQEVRVAFDNDFFAPPQDRNLFVDSVSVNCGTAFQMSSGVVSIEAEHFHAQTANGSGDTWTLTANGLASASAGLLLAPDDGSVFTSNVTSTSPRLDYNVNFTTNGALFMHVRADAPHGASDSCFGGIDGAVNLTHFDFADTPGTWGWITRALNIPSTGVHKVQLWGREDGLLADKIVVSTSATPPSGTGPAESPQL